MKIFILLLLSTNFINSQEKNRFGWDSIKEVVIITSENIENMINSSAILLINFCTSTCTECQKFKSVYDNATEFLTHSDIFGINCGHIDISKEKRLIKKYNIEKTPTVKLLTRHEVVDFVGERTVENIINFVFSYQFKGGNEITRVDFLDNLESCRLCAFLYIKDSTNFNDQLRTFRGLITKFPQIQFYYANSEKIAEIEGLNDLFNLVLYRNFDGGKKTHSSSEIIKENEIEDFLNVYLQPNCLVFNNEIAKRVFLNEEIAAFIFGENFESEKMKLFEEIAQEKVGMLFIKSKFSDELGSSTSNFLGVKSDEVDSIMIVKFDNGVVIKHKLKTWEKADLSKFIDDFKNDKLSIFYKSETNPKQNSKLIQVITGKMFDDQLLKNKKDTLLLITASYCSHSKKAEVMFEEIASLLAVESDLVFAKIEGTENEHPNLPVKSYPLIRLLKKDEKQNPIDFDGEKSVGNIIEFLEKELGTKFNVKEKIGVESVPITDEL